MVANWQLCQDEKKGWRASSCVCVCVKVAPKKEEDCFAVPAEFRDAFRRLPLPLPPEAVSTLIWRTWRGEKRNFLAFFPEPISFLAIYIEDVNNWLFDLFVPPWCPNPNPKLQARPLSPCPKGHLTNGKDRFLLRPPAAHISYLVGKYMAFLLPFAWENIVCTFRQIFFFGLPLLVYSFHPKVNEINRFRGWFPAARNARGKQILPPSDILQLNSLGPDVIRAIRGGGISSITLGLAILDGRFCSAGRNKCCLNRTFSTTDPKYENCIKGIGKMT